MSHKSTRGAQANFQGQSVEDQAARHYASQNCVILERRFKIPEGEIDLIVQSGDLVIFVEVKARRSIDAAAQAVSMAQWQRIMTVAQVYVAEHEALSQLPMRFDLFAADRAGQFEVLENVTQGF